MSEFEQDSQTGDAVLIAACLQANSLQTGNFTGNLTIWQAGDPTTRQEALQRSAF